MIRLALASALLLAFCLHVHFAHARDNGQWSGQSEEMKEWFLGLRNPNSRIPCCSFADGIKLEDVEWKGPNEDGSYEVFYQNEWRRVDKDQVINPPDRKVGYAIIWWAPGVDHPYCFMPGGGT